MFNRSIKIAFSSPKFSVSSQINASSSQMSASVADVVGCSAYDVCMSVSSSISTTN